MCVWVCKKNQKKQQHTHTKRFLKLGMNPPANLNISIHTFRPSHVSLFLRCFQLLHLWESHLLLLLYEYRREITVNHKYIQQQLKMTKNGTNLSWIPPLCACVRARFAQQSWALSAWPHVLSAACLPPAQKHATELHYWLKNLLKVGENALKAATNSHVFKASVRIELWKIPSMKYLGQLRFK